MLTMFRGDLAGMIPTSYKDRSELFHNAARVVQLSEGTPGCHLRKLLDTLPGAIMRDPCRYSYESYACDALVKSLGSKAGSPHALRGRPAFALACPITPTV